MQFVRRFSQLAVRLRPTLPFLAQSNSRSFTSLLLTNATPQQPQLLSALNQITINQEAGFKVKVNLRKRCKDCYFVRRQNRLFVICPTHRRHKQMQMVKDEKNTWILSHATQGKVRAW